MSKKKKIVVQGGGDEWMSTYSDMVTLLMCFFVLLYAASTPDDTKFQYIFQSFNSVGKYINPFVLEEQNPGDSKSDEDGNTDIPPGSEGAGTQESNQDQMGLPANFDELFAWLAAEAEASEYSDSIEVSKSSSSRINIRFNNQIMFEGNSAVLLDSGKRAIMSLLPGIRAISDYIKSIKVQGHTAQGFSEVNDWDLSSARACSVLKYMDFQVVIPSEKYIAEGRAQYDPIAPNDTDEGRQQNRRVELVITRNDEMISDTPIIEDILKYDYGIMNDQSDYIDRPDQNGGALPDAVEQILTGLDSKYSNAQEQVEEIGDDYTGPIYTPPIVEIPEDILQEIEVEETEETEEAEAEG